MARGDGKAQRGRTRGVKKMAFGGNPGDMATGGFGTGNIGSGKSSSSPSGGLGSSSRDGGFGGAANGGSGRSDMRSPVSNAARGDYLSGANRASARLGPNAAQSMADAGVNPTVANLGARTINRTVSQPTRVDRDLLDQINRLSREIDDSNTAARVRGIGEMRALPDVNYLGPFGESEAFDYNSVKLGPAASLQHPVSYPRSTQTGPLSQSQELARIREDAKKALAGVSQAAPFQRGKGSPAYSGAPPSANAPFQSGKGSPANKPIQDRLPGMSGPTVGPSYRPVKNEPNRFPGLSGATNEPVYTPPETPAKPAVKSPAKPSGATVSPPRFGGPMFPNREGGGGRNQNKKKPIINMRTPEGGRGLMSDGGSVRGDGKANFGKTRGRTV